MIVDVERHPSPWSAAVNLALIVSVIAAIAAVVSTAAGDVPQAAVVLPVILVAFAASWIQTGRAHAVAARRAATVDVAARRRSSL